eukprot:154483-Pelagomonas_calceolata.AAC.1
MGLTGQVQEARPKAHLSAGVGATSSLLDPPFGNFFLQRKQARLQKQPAPQCSLAVIALLLAVATAKMVKEHHLPRANAESATYCPSKRVFAAGGEDM